MSVEAIKQMVKALEMWSPMTHTYMAAREEAIAAGKTAIEQAEKQEPVATVRTWHKNGDQHAELGDWELGLFKLPDGEHTLYTTPPAQEFVCSTGLCYFKAAASVQEPHLVRLLEAMSQESNAKANLNEWMRSSPAMAVRVAQAEDEWVKSVKHLVKVQMAAEAYVKAAPPAAPVQEPGEADELLVNLGLDPQTYRTDGGAINYLKVKAALRYPEDYPSKREHITNGSPCWCNPETDYVDPETGAAVIVHKEPQ